MPSSQHPSAEPSDTGTTMPEARCGDEPVLTPGWAFQERGRSESYLLRTSDI